MQASRPNRPLARLRQRGLGSLTIVGVRTSSEAYVREIKPSRYKVNERFNGIIVASDTRCHTLGDESFCFCAPKTTPLCLLFLAHDLCPRILLCQFYKPLRTAAIDPLPTMRHLRTALFFLIPLRGGCQYDIPHKHNLLGMAFSSPFSP